MSIGNVQIGDLIQPVTNDQKELLNCHKLFKDQEHAYYKTQRGALVPQADDKFLVLDIKQDDNAWWFLHLQNVSDHSQSGWVEIWEEGYQDWHLDQVWKVVARTE